MRFEIRDWRYEIGDWRYGYKQQSSAEAELCVTYLNTLYSVLLQKQ